MEIITAVIKRGRRREGGWGVELYFNDAFIHIVKSAPEWELLDNVYTNVLGCMEEFDCHFLKLQTKHFVSRIPELTVIIIDFNAVILHYPVFVNIFLTLTLISWDFRQVLSWK